MGWNRADPWMKGLFTLAFLVLLAPNSGCAEVWSKSFLGSSPADIQQTSDGNYIVTGSIPPFGGSTPDLWVMKFDPSGRRMWERAYGGASEDHGKALCEAVGGGFFVGGTTRSFGAQESDGWLLKLDSDGDVMWEQRYPGAGPDWIEDLTATADGGVVVTGWLDPSAAAGNAVAKLSASGDVEWATSFMFGMGLSTWSIVSEAANQDIFLATYFVGTVHNTSFLLTRLSPVGAVLWSKIYHLQDEDSPACGIATTDNGFLLAGSTNSSGASGWDLLVLKVDSAGAPQWETLIGGPGDDWARAITADPGGGYLLGASNDSNLAAATEWWHLKLGPVGGVVSQHLFAVEYGRIEAVVPSHDGGFLTVGLADFGSGEWDGWILKTDSRGWSQSICADLTTTPVTAQATTATVADASPSGIAMTKPWTVTQATVVDEFTTTACQTTACIPFVCQGIQVSPEPACEGEAQTCTAIWSGGEGLVEVQWDLDGDTIADASGPTAVQILPLGTTTIRATVVDECSSGQQSCDLQTESRVLPIGPLEEVSDVRAGDSPLRLSPGGGELTLSSAGDASAYNVYADRLGSWYAPSLASGSACHLPGWTDNGDGTVSISYDIPPGSWVVVTAVHRCGEGAAGSGSAGIERTTLGTWELCGPSP